MSGRELIDSVVEGIPYQTLVTSILRKQLTGTIKETNRKGAWTGIKNDT